MLERAFCQGNDDRLPAEADDDNGDDYTTPLFLPLEIAPQRGIMMHDDADDDHDDYLLWEISLQSCGKKPSGQPMRDPVALASQWEARKGSAAAGPGNGTRQLAPRWRSDRTRSAPLLSAVILDCIRACRPLFRMAGEEFSLKWNDHSKVFFAGAEKLAEDEEYTDVTLAAGDKLFPAHKMVLAICSPYFQRLFRKLGTDKTVIYLKDILPRHLDLLIQYMYKGEIKVEVRERPS